MADRGFGNQRFAKLCEENGFDFVLRINENLRIERSGKVENLEKYKGKNTKFNARVVSWDKEYSFEIRTKNGSTWFLIMPSELKNGAEKYEQRFSIEKCFQDQKSSGFDIEKCKIKKYDRFKRLYFTMCLAQLLIVIAGEYIETEKSSYKKNISYNRKFDLSIFKLGFKLFRYCFPKIVNIVLPILGCNMCT